MAKKKGAAADPRLQLLLKNPGAYFAEARERANVHARQQVSETVKLANRSSKSPR